MRVLVQHLTTTQDGNGNPRRLWAVYDFQGRMLYLLDEGYEGRQVLKSVLTNDQYAGAVELPSWEITPAEYRTSKRSLVTPRKA